MKPIGYWLNRTDKALTRCMDAMLAEFGLTRIAWQVLNVIEDAGDVTDAQVLTTLAANADAATLSAAIDTVRTGGWATRSGPGRLALTAEGTQRLATVAARVDTFRERSMTGITPDEYRIAVQVLERMTHNLEPLQGSPVRAGSASAP